MLLVRLLVKSKLLVIKSGGGGQSSYVNFHCTGCKVVGEMLPLSPTLFKGHLYLIIYYYLQMIK